MDAPETVNAMHALALYNAATERNLESGAGVELSTTSLLRFSFHVSLSSNVNAILLSFLLIS